MDIRTEWWNKLFNFSNAKLEQDAKEWADDMMDFRNSKDDCIKQAKEAMEAMVNARNAKQYNAAMANMKSWLEKLKGVEL